MLGRFMVSLSRFMYGRYGADRLFKGLTVLYLIVMLISVFIGVLTDWYAVYYILRLLMTAILIWAFFRVLSRNINARRRENAKYCAVMDKLFRKKSRPNYGGYGYGGGYAYQPKRSPKPKRDNKTYKYVKCSCGATLRLKRRKGTHTATCPKCGSNVKVKSLF